MEYFGFLDTSVLRKKRVVICVKCPGSQVKETEKYYLNLTFMFM